ncbi:MAG: helix-turn-helix transcriptional regulator [Bacteroidota bacterium]
MADQEIQFKLGERIKQLRIKRNMTQNELAMECDFEKASMSRIESGQANPTIRTLYKICNALNIDIIELFSEETVEK